MDRKKWEMCGRKKRYKDEHMANYYRRKFQSDRAVVLDYYWCPYCHGYHLTSEEFVPQKAGEKLAAVYALYA